MVRPQPNNWQAEQPPAPATKLPRSRLTDSALQKLPQGGQIKDDHNPGLRARRQAKKVVFELRYRSPVDRAQRTLKLGTYRPDERSPKMSPSVLNAIYGYRDAMDKLERGLDPRIDIGEEGFTLRQALDLKVQELRTKGKSERTIDRYERDLRNHASDWLDRPLNSFRKAELRHRHQRVTAKVGPTAANDVMRAFSACWNRAAKEQEDLGQCPTVAVDANEREPASSTALRQSDLPEWRRQVDELPGPLRDYHLLVLYSGLRRRDAAALRAEQVDLENGTLSVPKPKGGAAKAFELPLNRPLRAVLERRLKAVGDEGWLFPSARSSSGHLEEPRADGLPSPHALRRTFSTAATLWAEVTPIKVSILMNHSLNKGELLNQYVNERDPRPLASAMEAVGEALAEWTGD
jgi:integrase